jgi:hypothetical protein
MFHHSFEHIDNPKQTLTAAAKRLKQGGFMLIRIPVFPSFAWRRYGVNWVNLDAPRHLYLYSKKSLGMLAQSAGFIITKVEYDAPIFGLYASERYEQGLTGIAPVESLPPTKRAEYESLAARLNETGEADWAAFYLRWH